MDKKEVLSRLRDFMSLEQEFLHKSFMAQTPKLDKSELIDILDLVHANYLVRGRLFTKLAHWCSEQDYPIPGLDELLSE
jgi:hypothetical protein